MEDDALALSAPLARKWAGELCGGCAPYHAIWQYLRLLGFATTPRDHEDFYRDAFRPLIRQGMRRVLVSGSADYAMPESVVGIYYDERVTADLTIVDACRTPLKLCEWFAARAGVAPALECADLLSYHQNRSFEILCTHVLFGHIAPPDRPTLVARWHALLVSGGRVVTVNRIRPEAHERAAYSEDGAHRFGELVLKKAEQLGDRLDLAPEALAAMAQAYYATRQPYAVHSADEVTALLEGAGFTIEVSQLGPVEMRSAAAPVGPSMPGSALYHKVVAVRK